MEASTVETPAIEPVQAAPVEPALLTPWQKRKAAREEKQRKARERAEKRAAARATRETAGTPAGGEAGPDGSVSGSAEPIGEAALLPSLTSLGRLLWRLAGAVAYLFDRKLPPLTDKEAERVAQSLMPAALRFAWMRTLATWVAVPFTVTDLAIGKAEPRKGEVSEKAKP